MGGPPPKLIRGLIHLDLLFCLREGYDPGPLEKLRGSIMCALIRRGHGPSNVVFFFFFFFTLLIGNHHHQILVTMGGC